VPYPAGTVWADPDLEAAVQLMRYVYENPEEAEARGRLAREYMRERHSTKRTAAFIADRIATIRETTTLATTTATPDIAAHADPSPPSRDALDRAERYITQGPENPLDAPSRLGAIGRFYRRILFRLLRPYAVRQRELEVAVIESIQEARADAEEARADAEAAAERHAVELRKVDRRLRDEFQRQIEQLSRVQTQSHEIFQRLEEFVTSLTETEAEVTALASHLRAEPYVSEPKLLRTTDPSGREAIGYNGNERTASTKDIYRGFEDLFRGSEDFVRDRQRVYLALIGDRQPVLDVGCGRGEFLELLTEKGITARGIDIDGGMVEHCRTKGHDVELAEGNIYLDQQADDSLGAIFAAQVIEHMPYDELTHFFERARQKLSADGIFIVETVNPHSLRAMKAFWVDPTHQTPIFPEVAAALCWLHGYGSARVVFPNGTGPLERDLFEQGEYAVVATAQ
jgi:2-polyprenyl-3-methyl-5-hydroxy-6-metoxy-1,4-benzoquinol methylase